MARISKKHNEYVHAVDTQNTSDVSIYRTALYARLSVEDGGSGTDTIAVQLQMLHDYIADKPQFNFCGEYVDNGFSGTTFERPEFQRLMEQVQAKEIDCIIVKDLSRLGRNYIETGTLIQKICPMLNLRIIAVNDRFDSSDSSADADTTMSLLNIANDVYAKDISRKVCSSLQGKMERGDYIGNYAPYGYLKDPLNKNHLIPDPALIETVNRIFQMRADGMGIGKIAAILNAEDIPSPGRYRYEHGIITNNNKKGSALLWNRHVLTDLLKNVAYIGNLAQAKWRQALYKGESHRWTTEDEWIIIENTHEGIVPRELFDRVQAVNASRRDAYKNNAGKYAYLPKAENPFGKRLVCADCGAVIRLHRSFSTKKDKAYFTYKCPTFVEHREQGCTDKSISQEELDAAVLSTIQAHVQMFSDNKEIIERLRAKDMRNSKRAQNLAKIRELEKRLQQREALRVGLYRDLKDGLLSEEEYLFSKESYSKEIESVQQSIAEIKGEIKDEAASLDHYSHWLNLLKRYKNITSLSKDVVEAFVQTVQLHENGKIEVTLNYMDEFNAAKELSRKRGKEVA